jgi:glycine cleavage system aminomethyltransferase T
MSLKAERVLARNGWEISTDGKLVKGRLPAVATVKAEIVPTPFYDPEGLRMKS